LAKLNSKLKPEQLRKAIYEKPHLLGNYLGYNLLTDIHSKWIKDSWESKNDVVIQAHRNAYKTTAVLNVGAIWYLLFNPEATVLIVRKEYEGASSILSAITRLYEGIKLQALYQLLGFPKAPLKYAKKDSIILTYKNNVTNEGSIDSLGIGGAITGRHYDKILCDDIATLKDRVSKAEREKTKSFVRELLNIKKANGTITFTGTPWHKDDIFSVLPEADKYPYGSIDIPELTPKLIEEIKKRTTPSLFAINYQLKYITDENKIFSEAKYSDWVNDASGIIAHIDCAYAGDHYTALTLAEVWEGKYILLGYTWRKNIVDLYPEIAGILRSHNCGTCYMETNADKGLAKIALQKYYPVISGYHEKENKHNKIIGHLKYNWQDVYFATESDDEYVNQVIDYEEGQEPDDCADSAACVLRVIKKNDGEIESKVEDLYKQFAY